MAKQEGEVMDIMEGIAFTTAMASPGMRNKILIAIACILIIGAAIGFLGALYTLQKPLNDHYQQELNRITANGHLKCFDLSNMTITGSPIVVDSFKIDACYNELAKCEQLNPSGMKPVNLSVY